MSFLYGPALIYRNVSIAVAGCISLLYPYCSSLVYYFTFCLQEQKLNKLVIDTGNAKEFERSFKSNPKSNELVERSSFNSQSGDSKPLKSDRSLNSLNSSSSPEEMQKP
jgi:hypothetical protein